MSDVFLSYSRSDTDQMRQVRAALRAEGLEVWTDETGLVPGTPDWEKAIARAIQQAKCVVVLLSPEAAESRWVGIEVAYAEERSIRLFPVLVRGTALDAIPIRLTNYQFIDARTDIDMALHNLLTVLGGHLGVVLGKAATRQSQAISRGPAPKPAKEQKKSQRGGFIIAGLALGVVVVGLLVVVTILVSNPSWLSSITGQSDNAEPRSTQGQSADSSNLGGEEEVTPDESDGQSMAFGTPDNPLRFGLLSLETSSGDLSQLAQVIESASGLTIKVIGFESQTELVDALCAGDLEAADLSAFAYLKASEKSCADTELVSEHFGQTFYQGEIIARSDSGITSVANLAGTKFCRPDPASTSGWLVPSVTMLAEGLNPDTGLGTIVDSGGFGAVVSGVYNGDCDAGSVFVDARTIMEDEFPDVLSKVTVVIESAPIPNNAIAYASHLGADERAVLQQALLAISADAANAELLDGFYGLQTLVETSDSLFNAMREEFSAAGVNIVDYLD